MTTIAKNTDIAFTQAHITQTKADAQVYASFLVIIILWLYHKFNAVSKNKNVCFPMNNLIFGYFLTIDSLITTFFNGLSLDLLVFDLATQTFTPNQIDLRQVNKQ